MGRYWKRLGVERNLGHLHALRFVPWLTPAVVPLAGAGAVPAISSLVMASSGSESIDDIVLSKSRFKVIVEEGI